MVGCGLNGSWSPGPFRIGESYRDAREAAPRHGSSPARAAARRMRAYIERPRRPRVNWNSVTPRDQSRGR